MDQNEQYCGGIKKKITAKLMQSGMNSERDENRQEKSNRTHTHVARHEKQRSRESFKSAKKRNVWISMVGGADG
jgi:hypothetical protein